MHYDSQSLSLDNVRLELLTVGQQYLGVGRVWIDDVLVRSGRLPMSVWTQTFDGLELYRQDLLEAGRVGSELRIRTRAFFRRLGVKGMRDHSFDPIHETGDWDDDSPAGQATLDLVIRPCQDSFGGVALRGFSYHYEYDSENVAIYWLMDRSSWELDGDIRGATVVSQSACSDPVVTFDDATAWTTEGVLHFSAENAIANPVMTHNLPRWASHGSFDFQYKGGRTLAGVFQRVGLIRSVLRRDAGKAELKCFDKHIFDQTNRQATVAKRILLAQGVGSEVAQRNLWTWMFQEVDDRARGEFGIQDELPVPVLGWAYWQNWSFDTWYRDLLPAAAAIGAPMIFTENCKKSAYSEDAPLAGVWHWNKCIGHEFEVADKLGGSGKLKEFIERAGRCGVEVLNWMNTSQGISSPLNRSDRDDGSGSYVLLEDARQKWGGAYMGAFHAMDLRNEKMPRYTIDSLVKIRRETGLRHLLWDSFYNISFMAVSFRDAKPHVQWRQCLQVVKELQDADVHVRIESFGPWGTVNHGCPRSYSLDRCWVCYRIGLGTDYTTVPTGQPLYEDSRQQAAAGLFYALAHMAMPGLRLFDREGVRIDQRWSLAHRQAMDAYMSQRLAMRRRFLQEDGLSVLWHDLDGTQATLWNFADRHVTLPGEVTDITTAQPLPKAQTYALQASHVYAIRGCDLPRVVG